MKIPVRWLKEMVDFEDTLEGLADQLTFAGLEVEHVETIGGTFDGIVVGGIVEVKSHPNADKLRLCTVEYGTEQPLCVVCGAPRVELGGKYAFAPVGTTLPGGIRLKKAKIRGEISMGMLCSGDELGLTGDHSGLFRLDPDTTPGTPLAQLMPPSETVFELEITPNRPDCLSIIGIAREVAALYGAELKMPRIELRESDETVDSLVQVSVEDSELCPRYTARVLKNATVGPSPNWMKARLEACGIRSINNIVDITNYVLLETGHPLHAFDYTLLKSQKIEIRHATPGEKLTTLDGVARELTDQMLVIADSERAIALAGIMGGADTEIKEDTSTLLLESASFEPSGIRHTAKALGLSSESSYRFQRGVNTDTVEWASRRAVALLTELTGAEICRGVVDVYPAPKSKTQVTIRWAHINPLIGLEIPTKTVQDIFKALEIEPLASDNQQAILEIPTFRNDITREIDLIEEIARLYGVDKIPAKLPTAQVVSGTHDHRVRAIDACRKRLAGLGAREIVNYTLVNHPLLDLFGKKDPREELPHPISADQSVLRTSLIPQMVESLGRNKSRQMDDALFFEIGRTFTKTEHGPLQTEKVCLGLMGAIGRSVLDRQRSLGAEEVFLWLKGLISHLLVTQKVSQVNFQRLENAPAFDEGRALKILSGQTEIGVLGLVNTTACKEWRLNDPVVVAELDLDPLLFRAWKTGIVADIPLYPAIERDYAFIVDEAVEHQKILKAINGSAPAELEKVELFDIFRGKGMGKQSKSLAYRFIYRSSKGTLTDEKVNTFHQAIGKNVCNTVSAVIRES